MQTGNSLTKFKLNAILTLLMILSMTIVSACATSATPSGADMAAGVFEQVGFEFLRWEEGLAIMIWHDFLGNSGSSSTSERSESDGPIYKIQGYAESWDGNRFEWEARTDDGKTTQFWLDDKSYDLSDGTLFIVTTKNGKVDVTQLDRDLSHVRPNADSCVAFAQSDPDVARFIGDVPTSPGASPILGPNPTPTSYAASPIPSPSSNAVAPPASWVTYTNSVHRFSLRHPPGLDVPPADFSEPRGFIGDRIVFSAAEQDPYWLGCLLEGLGDGPVVERSEFTRVGNPPRTAIKVSGFIGSIGGRVPQQYVTYLVRERGLYYTFTLYALGLDSEAERVNFTWPLDEADIAAFERMMATLTFRVGSGG